MNATTKAPVADLMKKLRAMCACRATTQADIARDCFGEATASARVAVSNWLGGTEPKVDTYFKLLDHAARITLRIDADPQLATEYRKAFKRA